MMVVVVTILLESYALGMMLVLWVMLDIGVMDQTSW